MANASEWASRCSSRRAVSVPQTSAPSMSTPWAGTRPLPAPPRSARGMETVVAQICAETLGVDYRHVRVVHGQTDRIERGGGAYASRVTVMTGEATRRAADALRDKALAAAAPLMQTTPDQLAIAHDII